MKVFELFSKRRKKELGLVPDVYGYDDLPIPLRIQIVHIWKDVLQIYIHYSHALEGHTIFKWAYEQLIREYGILFLNERHEIREQMEGEYLTALGNFLISSKTMDEALDVTELVFRVIKNSKSGHSFLDPMIDPLLQELNHRFQEHSFGYKFENGHILRIDSQIVHAEVVKPTLQLLSQKEYRGANEEFLRAHEHYRHQRYPECLNECLKSFESTMKVICHKRSWAYNQNDTAKTLIDNCLKNGLIPSHLQSHFAGLRACLESGIPTVRNKMSGHGQGVNQNIVPEYLASYLLHLTATSILLFVEAEKKLP